MNESVTISCVKGIPDIKPGNDLAGILIDCLGPNGIKNGDIIIIAHKVVSKAEGQIVHLDTVTPSQDAILLASKVNKDPRKVEVILNESRQVLKTRLLPYKDEGLIITEHRLGFICANSAVDESNTDQPNTLILLPENPDKSADLIRQRLEEAFNCQVGIVITDTFGRPWRLGLVNVAVGLSKVPSQVSMIGELDAYGRELSVTVSALADELAAASGLLMGKNAKKPILIFRGVDWHPQQSSALDLLRPQKEDLFR
jgi:coenzyme F420-0:L-glutamate ligase/coenzyme F420-1:gamma-L-glutamate ligase